MEEATRIERYQVKDLPDFIDSDFFKTTKVLPISRHRAISHFHNPKAEPDDEILYLLFVNEALVAYRLLLPDAIHFQNKIIRMAWVSCIWVDPKMRGRGYAQQLTSLALEAWGNRLMGQEFAPASRNMYKRMGMFDDFKTSIGYRAYVRLDTTTLIPKRRPKLRFAKPIFRLFDGVINAFQNVKLRAYAQKSPDEITVKESPKVDNEAWQFITTRQENEFMRRNQMELNWLLENPWVLTTATAKADALRFHFTSVAERFEQACVKVYKKDKLIAVLITSIKDEVMKVPYAYFEKEEIATIAQYLVNSLIKKEIKTFTVFQQGLSEYFKSKPMPFLRGRDFTRYYLYAKGFPRALKEATAIFQDGDGDAGFT